MPGPFRSRETLLLLVTGLLLLGGLAFALGLGTGWALGLLVVWTLVIFPRVGSVLQDRLLGSALAKADFDKALRIAVAMRNGAISPMARQIAAFDVGLVHLARGAPSDAARVLGRLDRVRLKERTRALVAVYLAVARLRSADDGSREKTAEELVQAASSALDLLGEEPNLLAAKAEGLLVSSPLKAREALERSLELDPDPNDPSPGERHVLFARAALATGDDARGLEALKQAAGLGFDAPFVRAAREELAQRPGLA